MKKSVCLFAAVLCFGLCSCTDTKSNLSASGSDSPASSSDTKDAAETISLGGESFTTDVTNLTISDTEVTDISVLAQCKNLQELILYSKSIDDYAPLSNLPVLNLLSFYGTTIDLQKLSSALSDSQTLKVLGFHVLKIDDPSHISDFHYLEELNIVGCDFSDLTPLEKMTNLTRLFLRGNEITTLAPLSGLITLQWLDASDNEKITDLCPISNLAQLQTLSMDHCNITDITPLEGLKNLETVTFEANHITDLTPLSNLPSLKEANLNFNQVKDFSALIEAKPNLNLLANESTGS